MGKSRKGQMSERQLKMIELLAEGKSYAEVGRQFGITASGARDNIRVAANLLIRHGTDAFPPNIKPSFSVDELLDSVPNVNRLRDIISNPLPSPKLSEDVQKIIAGVKNQLMSEESTTAYGEPQAFAGLGHGRCIEVTLEQEGLDEEDYFFSVRLHCNEAEFDNGEFHSSAGIIDEYTTSNASMDEIDELIIRACVCNKRHPVLDQYLSSGFVSLSDARSTGPHSKVSLSDQIASALIRTGATASASGMKRTGPESGR